MYDLPYSGIYLLISLINCAHHLGYPAVAWGSLLFSAIVFILTLVKTMKASRSARAAGIPSSIYSYLLRDGKDMSFMLIGFSC